MTKAVIRRCLEKSGRPQDMAIKQAVTDPVRLGQHMWHGPNMGQTPIDGRMTIHFNGKINHVLTGSIESIHVMTPFPVSSGYEVNIRFDHHIWEVRRVNLSSWLSQIVPWMIYCRFGKRLQYRFTVRVCVCACIYIYKVSGFLHCLHDSGSKLPKKQKHRRTRN